MLGCRSLEKPASVAVPGDEDDSDDSSSSSSSSSSRTHSSRFSYYMTIYVRWWLNYIHVTVGFFKTSVCTLW